MSEISQTNPSPPITAAAARKFKPRSFTARLVLDVVGRWGARIGLAWIAVIAFCAVFAPLLANSHPLLMKHNGQWSSPMLRHLTPTDVVLMIMFVSLCVLSVMRSLRFATRFWILVLILAVSIPAAIIWVTPPRLVIYDQYRQAELAGEIEFILKAPIAYSPMDYQRDRIAMHPLPPGALHLMGTERNGGDIFSRMIHAARIAMAVGFIATGIAMVIGIIIGGMMGYFGGLVDLLGMRLVEIESAIPTIYLLLTFVAFFDRNIYLIMVIIGGTGWMGYALFVRAEFFKLRKQDFVQAAQACGLPLWSILFRHMLPNGIAPVQVSVSFGVASAILAESGLSFLGLGLVDEPSWGQMLNQAISPGGGFYWWLATFPGLAIFLTVFAYNLVGEAMRDAIDPHTKKAAAL